MSMTPQEYRRALSLGRNPVRKSKKGAYRFALGNPHSVGADSERDDSSSDARLPRVCGRALYRDIMQVWQQVGEYRGELDRGMVTVRAFGVVRDVYVDELAEFVEQLDLLLEERGVKP